MKGAVKMVMILATRIIHIYRAFLYSTFQRMSLYFSFTLFYLFPRRGTQCSIIKRRLVKERKGKKSNWQVPNRINKNSLCTNSITSPKGKNKEKRKLKMIVLRKKWERQQKQSTDFAGRSYSAPKPVWELLLVRQLQIILGEKLFGPQARLRITPITWFEPATSMTSHALVARLRLPLDHLESTYLICINCRCKEFWNTRLGGRVRNFVGLRVQSSVSGQE